MLTNNIKRSNGLKKTKRSRNPAYNTEKSLHKKKETNFHF